MCALFSYFHWLTMVAILQLKTSKHLVYFVSIAVVTFTLLTIYSLYILNWSLGNANSDVLYLSTRNFN